MSPPEQSTSKRDLFFGRMLILIAAVMWSTAGFFAKAPYFADWPGVSLAFWRAAFASVVLAPLIRQPRFRWGLVPMVLCFVLMNVTFLTALKTTEASNVVWLQNTAPIWVFFVSVFVLREQMHERDVWMAMFGAAGVILILAFEIRNASPAGVVYGLLAAFTYAGVVLSLRHLRDEQSAWLIALNHLVTAAVLAPFVLLAAGDEGTFPRGVQWPLLACFGVLQMGLPYVMFARGLRRLPGHEASGIALLEPLLTPLWVFLAWGAHPSYEPPRWWTITGGGLILIGLGIRYLALKREVEAGKKAECEE